MKIPRYYCERCNCFIRKKEADIEYDQGIYCPICSGALYNSKDVLRSLLARDGRRVVDERIK